MASNGSTIMAAELNKLLQAAMDAAARAGDGDGDAAEEARAVDALRVLGQQRVTAALLASTGGLVRQSTKQTRIFRCSYVISITAYAGLQIGGLPSLYFLATWPKSLRQT
jgi:hypothetical protein